MTIKKDQQLLNPTTAPEAGQRPYLNESHDFRVYVAGKRTASQRAVEDLDVELDRLHAEIDARLLRRAEHTDIIARCDAALQLELPSTPRPAPPEETAT